MYKNPFASKVFLVIDDFGDMRNMLRSIVRMLGATKIDVAVDGKEAIACMEKKKYDIVLCDYNLGSGKDGQQVLEEARHRGLISMASIFVMVTAENTRQMVMGAIEYEPDGYFSKPFSKDLIKVRLEKMMARKDDLAEVYAALARKKQDEAIRLIDEKLSKRPKNAADLMRMKAEICLEAGKFECAAEIYERVLVAREIPWAKLGLGRVLFAQKRYQEAVEVFRDLAESNPDLTAGLDWLARAHQMLGEIESAKTVVQTAVNLSPKAILRQQLLGDLSLQTGDLKTAETAFQDAVSLGKNSVFKNPSMYARLAKTKTLSEKHDEALGVVRQLDREFDNDQDADLFAVMTEAVIRQNQGDAEKAKKLLDQATSMFDKSSLHHSNAAVLELAQAAAHLGDKAKAEAILTTAVQNNHDNDEFLSDITAVLKSAGISDDAESLVHGLKREIIEMNNRGVKLLQQGQVEQARELFKGAAERMPGNKVINLNAARVIVMIMEKKGLDTDSLGQVRQYLDRIKKIAPDDPSLKNVMGRLQKLVMSR